MDHIIIMDDKMLWSYTLWMDHTSFSSACPMIIKLLFYHEAVSMMIILHIYQTKTEDM